MKRILLSLVIGVATRVGSYGLPPLAHSETGISFPDKIGGLTRHQTRGYQVSPEERGMLILYRNAWATARVLIRKNGPKFIGSPAAVVNETLAAIKEKAGSGECYKAEVFETGDDSARAGWAKGVFFNNGPYFVYATIKGDYCIKLCFGCNRLNEDAIEKSVGEFQRLVDEGKPKL